MRSLSVKIIHVHTNNQQGVTNVEIIEEEPQETVAVDLEDASQTGKNSEVNTLLDNERETRS